MTCDWILEKVFLLCFNHRKPNLLMMMNGDSDNADKKRMEGGGGKVCLLNIGKKMIGGGLQQ